METVNNGYNGQYYCQNGQKAATCFKDAAVGAVIGGAVGGIKSGLYQKNHFVNKAKLAETPEQLKELADSFVARAKQAGKLSDKAIECNETMKVSKKMLAGDTLKSAGKWALIAGGISAACCAIKGVIQKNKTGTEEQMPETVPFTGGSNAGQDAANI